MHQLCHPTGRLVAHHQARGYYIPAILSSLPEVPPGCCHSNGPLLLDLQFSCPHKSDVKVLSQLGNTMNSDRTLMPSGTTWNYWPPSSSRPTRSCPRTRAPRRCDGTRGPWDRSSATAGRPSTSVRSSSRTTATSPSRAPARCATSGGTSWSRTTSTRCRPGSTSIPTRSTWPWPHSRCKSAPHVVAMLTHVDISCH